MIGKYTVEIENAFLKYKFEIKRNITIIKGNSATGKTTLIYMLDLYYNDKNAGVNLRCEKDCVVLSGRNWQHDLEIIDDSIVFIDEQNRFIKSKEFAATILKTNNYYVIITREKLSNLPYSVNEIYGFRESGRYLRLGREFTENEFYNIYGLNPSGSVKAEFVISEDSNSGYDFWNTYYECKCEYSSGNANLLNKVKDSADKNNILVIVDGAAYGPYLEQMLNYIKYENGNVEIYAPESFEYILLSSDIFTSNEVKDKINFTEEYADSIFYSSWEQYYTALIIEETKNSNMAYSKKKLNDYYLSDRNINLIEKVLPEQIRR